MPGPPEVDDASLIARIARHDPSAMDELVRRHGAALFRHARSMAGGDATRVEGHVAECRHCASFGARYAMLVSRVRGVLADPETEEAALARLRARLPGVR